MMGSARQRCTWCHGARGDLEEIQLPGETWSDAPALVHPGHERRLRDFLETARRRSQLFVILVVAAVFLVMNSTLVAIVVAQWVGLLIMGAALAGLAVTIMIMPFATPQTARAVGVRRSIVIARACGLGVGVLGLVLLAVALSMALG